MRIKTFLALIVLCCTVMLANAQRTCAAQDILQEQLQDPKNANQFQMLEQQIQDFTANYNPAERVVITLPIVFHVIHDGDAVGSGENISDAQIMAQLDQLNQDFSATNSDIGNVPAVFSGVVANAEIQFCLAQVDPDGNPSTGIERHNYSGTSTSGFTTNQIDGTIKPQTIWDRDCYLNFWIVRFGGGDTNLLGYAQFPNTGSANTDGVVHGFGTIGSLAQPGSSAPYDRGRTATHEIGHWLGLYHIWGDINGGGCGGDDNIADTPIQSASNGGCPNHPSASCGNGGDMFMNYMDYVNDVCMYMFTEGQKTRMMAVLNGFRSGVRASCACTEPTCDDNIQNGLETGVDCGGPDCPACPPSCNDGIMNQDETGIDCGGSICPACPTCTDGQQNGDETGVDCGGPDCPACPETCNDGIQNQDETGVDCGGVCPPCAAGTCQSPIILNCGDSYTGTTVGEANDDTNYNGATYPYTGGDLVFQFTITASPVDIDLTGLTADLDLLVMDACDPAGGNLLGESTNAGTNDEGLTTNGGSLGAGTYYLFVDGYGGATGDFTISLTSCTTPETCTDGIMNQDETGIDCGGTNCPPCPVAEVLLSPKVFLQGPLSGTTMTNALMGGSMLPTTSPYDGTPLVGTAPANAIDWVEVEIRSDDTASPAQMYSASGLLLDDGTVVGPDGSSALSFPVAPGQSWFIVVKHRNHLGIMTNSAIQLD